MFIKIKTWEQMKREYGLDSDGDGRISGDYFQWFIEGRQYSISDDMIEVYVSKIYTIYGEKCNFN